METTARPTAPWRPVVIPAEHGGWGFLAEPVVLGLVLAPSAAGVCLGLAALSGFLARHPLRLWFMDWRRRVRYPRTALAGRAFGALAAVALFLTTAGFLLARAPFWPVLVAAAPVGLAALAFDARGRSRDVSAEVTGAVALGASVTAIALAGGASPGIAWGAWALLALRGWTSILYVRARIRLDRGLTSGPWLALAGHGATLLAAGALAGAGWAPWLSTVAFGLLLARAAWGLSPWRRPIPPKALGFQELGFGILTLLLLALGYRAGA
jgi:hypothetical protein